MKNRQMKAYLFVDAENHFLRSTAAAERVFGSPKAAEALFRTDIPIHVQGFPIDMGASRFQWELELQMFWDCGLLSPTGGLMTRLQAEIHRAIYVCSCVGDDEKVHSVRRKLRNYGFEPVVVKEKKELKNRRDAGLEKRCIMEKAKGCDITLATRMVADAALDLFDCCLLFTSDADFIPAVEAVRRMGKIVWVFGYSAELQERSPYLFVPDRFIDLEENLGPVKSNHGDAIKRAILRLDSEGS